MSNYLNQISQALENQRYMFSQENSQFSLYHQSKICGDKVKVFISLDKKDGSTITSISYENSACGLNTMILEWLCATFEKKSISELKSLKFQTIENKFRFPKGKSHCVELILDVIDKLE